MKTLTIFGIFLQTFFISHAFVDFELGKHYIFHYRSETSGKKQWVSRNQSIDTEVQVRKTSEDSIFVQLKNAKINDEIENPTSDEIRELTYPFKILLENNSFSKYLTKEKEFVYCLKLKYRVIDMLLSDMSRFTEHKDRKNGLTKVQVKNLAFGNCESKLKVVKGTDEIKIGVKAEYKDCHADGRVNLATVFDLSPNSTTAVIVSIKTKDEIVKKINVLSDMVTYNMGGLHLKLRSSLTFKGLVDTDEESGTDADYKTTYTQQDFDRFLQNVD